MSFPAEYDIEPVPSHLAFGLVPQTCRSQAAASPRGAAQRREMTGISEYRPWIAILSMTCGNGL
jgi:hypothetical protein